MTMVYLNLWLVGVGIVLNDAGLTISTTIGPTAVKFFADGWAASKGLMG